MKAALRKALLVATAAATCAAPVLRAQHAARAQATATAIFPAVTVPLVREGSAIALSRHEERLYVASEELRSLRVFALPARGRAQGVAMPGAPANVLVLPDDRVLVTVRDPGLLLVLRPDADAGLVEIARVPLAADAWGLALSPDGATAYVTSAWTHTLTAVDLASLRVRWTLDVPREPRGIVAHPRGPLYVSHLTSGLLTRVDVTDGVPASRPIDLPLSPLRTPRHGEVAGSLGYALALSPDGTRLYAPRHALGVVGEQTWFGAATVDVLMVPGDSPLAPPRAASLVEKHAADTDASTYPHHPSIDPATGPIPLTSSAPFSQPRAIVYRRTNRTILVAGEADRALTVLDALAPDPTLAVVATLSLGVEWNDSYSGCIAPSGIALSEDESTAYVYCRASLEVLSVSLDGGNEAAFDLGRDPLEPVAAYGRKLFYTGRRPGLSEGLACSGCHPEGRDDGHVWHEVDTRSLPKPNLAADRIFVGGSGTIDVGGAPRQTPMLAGRLGSPGPYGWLGQDADLVARITHGAALHRWEGWGGQAWEVRDRKAAIERLAAFVRVGLVPPPRPAAPLSPEQARGQALFERRDVGCASCHVKDDGVPALVTRLPPLPVRQGFDPEDVPLKVPSLRFAGGTPPYLHDGSEATLRQLVEDNHDRMGHTVQLSAEDRAALAAYLETL